MKTTSNSNSRQTILDRLRSIPIDAPKAQPIDRDRLVRYADPVAKFSEILSFVGGAVHIIDRPEEVAEILAGFEAYTNARFVASLLPDVITGNFHCQQVEDPHALASLDWAIIPGEFAVAENGAIWVRPDNMIERTMIFLTQHLAILVSRSDMTMHMHDAYRRIRESKHCGAIGPDFGVFVSGPSKTADIEQSLVIGAHGCRSLQVFLTP